MLKSTVEAITFQLLRRSWREVVVVGVLVTGLAEISMLGSTPRVFGPTTYRIIPLFPALLQILLSTNRSKCPTQ